jgi:hypothetical protein
MGLSGSRPESDFILLGRLATSISVTRPNRVRGGTTCATRESGLTDNKGVSAYPWHKSCHGNPARYRRVMKALVKSKSRPGMWLEDIA